MNEDAQPKRSWVKSFKPVWLMYFVLFLLGAQMYHSFMLWNEEYKVISPVVIRIPWEERHVTPVGKVTVIELNKEPDINVLPPTSTPMPTPKKRALKIDLVRDVEASSTNVSVEEYICSKGWDCSTAVAIAQAESGLVPSRVSYDGCCMGVFQIHTVHAPKFDGVSMLDMEKNIDVAYQIYLEQSWNPWGAFTNGSYKKYL